MAGLLLAGLTLRAAESAPDYLKARPEIVEAWKDLRFGLFICWGPVTLTGKEIGWSRGAPPWGVRPGVHGGKGPTPAAVYDALYKQWKPDQFNARAWVQIAQDAGARYLVFLIKHHDGFALFDTKLTDYRSTGPESAWKVDVMQEIAEACHAAGLKLNVYYSQPDWHHPDFAGEHHERYVAYLHGQIRELLTRYGRIDGLWFDGLGAGAKQWDAENLFKLARALQPWLIINDRCGLPGDYDTPEQQVGRSQFNRPWESCITLGTQWSWKPDDTLKSHTNAIYLHILRWPAETVTLPAIKPRIVTHAVLTGGEATVKQTDAGIEVSVAPAQRDACDTIVKLELDRPAKDIPVMQTAAGPSIGKSRLFAPTLQAKP